MRPEGKLKTVFHMIGVESTDSTCPNDLVMAGMGVSVLLSYRKCGAMTQW